MELLYLLVRLLSHIHQQLCGLLNSNYVFDSHSRNECGMMFADRNVTSTVDQSVALCLHLKYVRALRRKLI